MVGNGGPGAEGGGDVGFIELVVGLEEDLVSALVVAGVGYAVRVGGGYPGFCDGACVGAARDFVEAVGVSGIVTGKRPTL